MSAYVSIVCGGMLAIVFLASLASKVRSPVAFAAFVAGLAEMRVVPRPMARPLATTVVGLETATLLLLAVPAWHRAGLVLAGSLLAAFTGAIVLALRRQVSASCPCFGSSGRPLGRRHLVRNALLLGGVLVGLSSSGGQAPLDPGAVAVSVAAAAVLALTVITSEQMADVVAATDRAGGR